MPSRLLATQTLPKPTAIPVGERPTGIVVVTEFVSGLIRPTASSSRSATQTAAALVATEAGPFPTRVVAITRLLAGSMRAMVLPAPSLAHTAPEPAARLEGLLPVSMLEMTFFPAGSRRCISPSSAATQIAFRLVTTLAELAGSPCATGRRPAVTTSNLGSILISSG